MGVFLRANGFIFKPKHSDLLKTMLDVASGQTDANQLAEWIGEVLQAE